MGPEVLGHESGKQAPPGGRLHRLQTEGKRP